MLKIRVKTLSLLILMMAGMISQSSFAFTEVKTCVVSLIVDVKLNGQIQNDAQKILEYMGYDHREFRFDYYSSSPVNIRKCIEGDYEEVILISHSAELVPGHQSIVYKNANSPEWQVLNSRLFNNLLPGKNLRQITLATCQAEDVLNEYSSLKRMAKKYNVRIKLPLSSISAAVFSGGEYAGTRDQKTIAYMIAESAQDENADNVFCYLRTNLTVLVEHGSSICLRGHYQVKYRGYLSAGFKTSTKFLRIDRSETSNSSYQFSLVDFELAFIRGADLSISEEPLQISRDGYGISVGVFPFISLTRLD